MIQKTNKKFGKRYIAIAATALTLVLLIVAYIVINAILPGLLPGEEESQTDPPEIIAGEAIYGNRATIYPYLSPEEILAVQVDKYLKDEESDETVKDSYMMSKPKDDEGKRSDFFIFSYQDPKTEEKKVYYPDILYEDANFKYTDLYAVEKSNSLGVRKIDYLCAAIGALYFDERITLPVDPTEKAQSLNRYGLSESERETIFITYLDTDGTEKVHTLFIGNKLISGSGYYFMLAGRDCVYTSYSSDTLSYALDGFEGFIDARIIAAEVDGDKGSAPYHTTEYSQWTSKYHTVTPGSSEILTIPAGTDVVILANYLQPIYGTIEGEADTVLGHGTGYRPSGFETVTITNSSSAMKKLLASLVGKNVGSFTEDHIYTALIDMNTATLYNEEKNTGVYEYTIHSIESIVTDSGDITAVGTAIPEGAKIKVEYSYTLDGKRICDENSHAVIDLSKSSALEESIKDELRAAGVGPLSSAKTFTVKYTKDNAGLRKLTLVISQISLILDKDGKPQDKIDENSIVNFEYYYLLDGEKLGRSAKRTLILSDITEEHGDYSLKQLLIGKTADDRLFEFTTDEYCQFMMDFGTYEIRAVEGYIELEQTVSFSYVHEDFRDPFHAESLYKNTLPKTNKYSAYAMNDEACDEVLRIIGGINTSSNSTGASGLSGSETVAVGLSHATLEKYGLYDGYRIYFDLPRGLISQGDDYSWLDYIGFTLYIGTEIQSDGTIFVASDLYDIVVKIDPSTFSFLKFSFPEYWARRNLALVDIVDLYSISVNLDYKDLYGNYTFEFEHTPLYIQGDYAYPVKPESGSYSEYDKIDVTVKSLSDRRTDTLFSNILDSLSTDSEKVDFFGLANIYNVAGGNSPETDIMQGNDTLGTASMKEMLRMLYSTYYLGVLSPEQQAKASEDNKLMELTIDLGEKSDYTYRYEFFRIEDRTIMVSLYRVDSVGDRLEAVSDLYISDFAFKKLVSGFVSLLNGEVINADKAYE